LPHLRVRARTHIHIRMHIKAEHQNWLMLRSHKTHRYGMKWEDKHKVILTLSR